jgi:2'-5' RNA ligase
MSHNLHGHDKSARAQRAMTIGALMKRIALGAGPTMARWSLYPEDDITPTRIIQARREAHAGYPLQWCDLVTGVHERNSHLRSVWHQRRAWIFLAPYNCVPPEYFDQGDVLAYNLAAWTAAALGQLRACWVNLVYNLLSAAGYGWAAAEIFWGYRTITFTGHGGVRYETPGALVPVWAEPVGQKHFRFHLNTDEPLLWTGQGTSGQRWAHGKIVFHRPLGDGFLERRGFMTAGVWMDLATQQGWSFLLTYAKIFGLPQLAAFVEKHILDQEEERAEVDAMLGSWAEGRIPVFVDDVDVKQVGQVQGGTDGIHQSVIELAEREISKLVVGATLQHDQGNQIGSYGMAGTHETTSHMFVLPDGEGLARTFETDLHVPLLERNLALLCRLFNAYPDQLRARAPWGGWKAAAREPNAADWLEIFRVAKDINFPVSVDQVGKVLGLKVGQGMDVLPPSQTAAPAAAPGEGAPPAPPPPAPAAAASAPPKPFHGTRADRDDDPGVMVAWYPPEDMARELALPGGEAAEELHVTLAYLGRASALPLPVEDLATVVMRAAAHARSLVGRLGGMGRFAASETSDGKDVLYASVDVPGLAELRQRVVAAVERAGAEVARSHDFTPHMTLLYLEPDADSPITRVAPQPIEINDLWLVAGDDRRRFPMAKESA